MTALLKPLMLLLLLSSGQLLAKSIEFGQSELEKAKQRYHGKQWMVLLWSLDCPPCFKELAMVGRLYQQAKDLPVVLINTDGDDTMTAERDAIINKYQLTGLPNLHFADDQAAQGRFIIDSQWYGELPRSYFYAADGSRVGRSGLVDAGLLRKWLL